MPELSWVTDKSLGQVTGFNGALLGTFAKAIKEKYGSEGLAVLRDSLEELIRDKLGPLWAAEAGTKIGDGGLEDWVKVEKTIGSTMLQCEAEIGPDQATLRITACPYAEQFKRPFPEVCREVYIGFERGVVSAINPNLEVKGVRYLPEGAECCELICKFKS